MRQDHLRRLFPLLLLAGCAPLPEAAEKGAEDDIPIYGKFDSQQDPTEHGELRSGIPTAARLSRSERYHAWEFTLTGSARVDLQLGPAVAGGREVDTVMYLYREGQHGWGHYLRRNDDVGDSLWSAIQASLGAGRYRVLIKGYSARTYGDFAVTLTCAGAGCAALPPPCAFGLTFAGIDRTRFTMGGPTALTAASQLTALERQQVVLALHASTHTDVLTAEEAFQRVDGGVIQRHELRDWIGVRSYVAFEYGVGDSSYGALFLAGTTDVAAEIHDGDIAECVVTPAACIFGQHYGGLPDQPDLEQTLAAIFDPGSDVTALITAQILAAVRLQLPEVVGLVDTFNRVTDAEVRRVDLRHVPTGREYSFYTYILGDHRYGASFVKNSTTMVIRIEDDVFEGCAAF